MTAISLVSLVGPRENLCAVTAALLPRSAACELVGFELFCLSHENKGSIRLNTSKYRGVASGC